MTVTEKIKLEISFLLSKFIPIRIKCGVSEGMSMYGDIFYNRRSHDFSNEEILYSRLNLKNRVVIEAGTLNGVFTLFFAKQLQNGKVIAFEPNIVSYNLLLKNLKRNAVTNVIAFNEGLSNEVTHLNYVSSKYTRGKGTFKKNKQVIIKKSRTKLIQGEINTTTIDRCIEDNNLKDVYFVKIDTEGFEPYIIEGMSNCLSEHKPIIYFEIHGVTEHEKQQDIYSIFKFLFNHNYNISRLVHGLPSVSNENVESFTGGTYIAFSHLTSDLEITLNPWQRIS